MPVGGDGFGLHCIYACDPNWEAGTGFFIYSINWEGVTIQTLGLDIA